MDGLLHRMASLWQCSVLRQLLVAGVSYLGPSDTTCVYVWLGYSVCDIEHLDTIGCLVCTLSVQVQIVLLSCSESTKCSMLSGVFNDL